MANIRGISFNRSELKKAINSYCLREGISIISFLKTIGLKRGTYDSFMLKQSVEAKNFLKLNSILGQIACSKIFYDYEIQLERVRLSQKLNHTKNLIKQKISV